MAQDKLHTINHLSRTNGKIETKQVGNQLQDEGRSMPERREGRSDLGKIQGEKNDTTPVENRIATPELGAENALITAIENVREQIIEKALRRSDSYASKSTMNNLINAFIRFAKETNLTLEQCKQDPYDVLDRYAAYCHKLYMASTVRTYMKGPRNILKALRVRIDAQEYRDRVTLPKARPTKDDKFQKEEIRRLILAVKHPGAKLLGMIMKDNQARPSEVLGLRMPDFELSYRYAYFTIPSERAKNDIPRELFISDETKEMFLDYVKANNIGENDWIFLSKEVPADNEEIIQKRIQTKYVSIWQAYDRTMKRPEFADLRKKIRDNEYGAKYDKHIYSFKKFAFTAWADAAGEMAARAIKGDSEYVFTYYKKSREERAEDFEKVLPRLLIFSSNPESVKEQIQEELDRMKKDELAILLNQMRAKGSPASSKCGGG